MEVCSILHLSGRRKAVSVHLLDGPVRLFEMQKKSVFIEEISIFTIDFITEKGYNIYRIKEGR